ncbi:MAG TPA: glycosyltransferase family 2 protein [Kiritimatiellia bacterium]|nr:glycosyltransferase family 2 protein [Kiritimatiellia bacterium]
MNDAPSLSVLIPTHRRLDTLPRVLDEVLRQAATIPGGAEVVVCDDASGDDTPAVLKRLADSAPAPLRWISLETNRGPAAARNAALKHCRGDAVLILGDDIIPAPGLLARHAAWHVEHPGAEAALLGFCTWPAELADDPFLRWLEHDGRRYFFNYRDLPDGQPVSGMYFYTCNVSCKRALLARVGGFDESFPFASHEDLELGLRLERAGMRLVFDRGALAHHWHRLTLAGTLRRVYRMGYSSVIFWRKTPDPAGSVKRLARGVLSRLASIDFPRELLRRAAADDAQAPASNWARLLDLAYWCGVADGRAGRVDPRLAGGAR